MRKRLLFELGRLRLVTPIVFVRRREEEKEAGRSTCIMVPSRALSLAWRE